MDYTRKILTLIPINRNSNENKEVRAQYASYLQNISDQQLIFLDETGLNLYTFQRFGYSPRNTKCYISVQNSKGKNVSVLCAINNQGVLAYETKIGGFKSADLTNFIMTKLPVLNACKRKYIIMDSASIHRTAEVRETLAQHNYILKILLPYSPQLNSIEEFFRVLNPDSSKTMSLQTALPSLTLSI
jgi:hypothetical protein